ncbi:MAG: MBL fold metallo-hydrolase [Desulfobacteraceae bacterium]|nr:MAG: MBL fold metallo-hydrolase [Desulfobacteraceae bacterium]
MIEVQRTADVRGFRMARNFFGRGIYYTAAYWVDGLLIDTGCAYTVDEFVSALRPYPVKLIVNTHSHEDHIGANRWFQDQQGVEIRAHESAITTIAEPRVEKRLRPYQQVMWGYPEPSAALPIGTTIETGKYRFEVIHTPGHSRDHICLYEPNQGWLFCGDAYVGGRDKALRADYNIWQILSSLKRMRDLDVSRIFPGSGRVRDEARKILQEKVEYLERTGERILSLSDKGWSHSRIRRELFGKEMLIAYYTLGHFSGRHLVRSYVEDR